MWELLASRLALQLVIFGVSALWGSRWFRRWREDKLTATEKQLFEYARAAAEEVWLLYVEELKLAPEYAGRLTKAQRDQARNRALMALARRARGKTAALLDRMSTAEREVLIEDAVSSLKRN